MTKYPQVAKHKKFMDRRTEDFSGIADREYASNYRKLRNRHKK